MPSRFSVIAVLALCLALTGCTPFVGSQRTPSHALACPKVPDVATSPAPSTSAVATKEIVAVTERSAMSESDFWALLATLPRRANDQDFEALSSRLARCGLPTIVAFDARLTIVLYDLDTAKPCLWYSVNGGLPGPVYSDDFLYARGDTVLSGRSAYEGALSEGTLKWGPSEQGTGEYLLYVGQTAAETLGLSDAFDSAEEAAIPLSYESGTNPRSALPGDPQTACVPAS